MVFGFLVQSLQKNKEPYTCLSSFFTKEGNDNQQEERHQQITALVQNEFSMRQSYEEGMSALAVGGAQQPDTKAASKKYLPFHHLIILNRPIGHLQNRKELYFCLQASCIEKAKLWCGNDMASTYTLHSVRVPA